MEAIRLTTKERKRIKKMKNGRKTEYRMKERASIIWGLAVQRKHQALVAREQQVSTKTVRKWHRRFLEDRVEGLEDAPRPGAPLTYDEALRCEVIAVACDQPAHYDRPEQTFWTYDTLIQVLPEVVEGATMSRSTVWRILNDHALKPHQHTLWLHSKDPHFREKVNDIVGLYHADLPDDVALVGIDEKTGMQANEKKYDTQLPTPRKRGRVEFEYIRHGTQTLLGAFDIQTGEVTASCGKGRTATDLEAFMEQLAERYRHCRTIIVIWDNLNIHHEGPSERWKRFNARHGNKFEFHYTPIHASWVNQIEIFFSILGKRVLRHGSFVSKADLKRKVMSFITRWNTQDKHPFHWRFKGYSVSGQEVA